MGVKINLRNILASLVSIGVSDGNIVNAIDELEEMLSKLDEVEVKGRKNVDTLLGCMLAIEAIIGKEGDNG